MNLDVQLTNYRDLHSVLHNNTVDEGKRCSIILKVNGLLANMSAYIPDQERVHYNQFTTEFKEAWMQGTLPSQEKFTAFVLKLLPHLPVDCATRSWYEANIAPKAESISPPISSSESTPLRTWQAFYADFNTTFSSDAAKNDREEVQKWLTEGNAILEREKALQNTCTYLDGAISYLERLLDNLTPRSPSPDFAIRNDAMPCERAELPNFQCFITRPIREQEGEGYLPPQTEFALGSSFTDITPIRDVVRELKRRLDCGPNEEVWMIFSQKRIWPQPEVDDTMPMYRLIYSDYAKDQRITVVVRRK